MLAVEVEKMYAAQAPKGGRPKAGKPSPNLDSVSKQLERQSSAKAGARLNVSRSTVISAKKVTAHAAPEVVHAVRMGKIAVDDAVRVATLPKPRRAQQNR